MSGVPVRASGAGYAQIDPHCATPLSWFWTFLRRPARESATIQAAPTAAKLQARQPVFLRHSYLSAAMGSTRVALRAGRYAASNAAPVSSSGETMRVAGSAQP